MQQQRETMASEHASAKAELDAKCAALESKCAELEQSASEQMAAKAEVETKSAELEQTVQALKDQQSEGAAAAEAAREAAVAELTAVQAQLVAANTENQQQRETMMSEHATVTSDLESKCTELEQTVQNLEQQLSSPNTDSPSVLPDAMASCLHDLAESQQRNEKLTVEVQAHKATIKKGKGMYQGLKDKLQTRMSSEVELKSQLEKSTALCEEKTKMVMELSSKIKEGKGYLHGLNAKIKVLEQQVVAGSSSELQTIRELEAKVEHLQQEHQAEQKKVREMCNVPDMAQSFKMREEISQVTSGLPMTVTPSKVRRHRVKTPVRLPVSEQLKVKAQLEIERNQLAGHARAISLVQVLGERKQSSGDHFYDCEDPPFMPSSGAAEEVGERQQGGQGCAQQ